MAPLIPRHIQPLARGALDRFPIVAIQGARRVGKSTLAALLAEGRDHVAVTLDDDAARAAAHRDPTGFLAQRDGRTMVIDEVQRDPDLLLAIKADVDRDPQPGAYVITGSADFTASPRVPDSLAGRAVTIPLASFSQGELAGRREDFAAWARKELVRDQQAVLDGIGPGWARDQYVAAIVSGGYPEAQGIESRWRDLWLESYVDRLTSRDVLDVAGRLPAPRLRAVLGLIAANQAGELVKARLAQAAGISERSVTACVDALRGLHLVAAVQPWTTNLTKRRVGRAKAVVPDSGLAAQVAGVDAEWLATDVGGTALGSAFEGFVVGELLKQRTWSAERWTLSHFRDRDGLEVDAVLQFTGGRVVLVEVKASQSFRSEQFGPMLKLADRLGDRLIAGVVLSMADGPYRFGKRMWGLPASALWTHGPVGPQS